MTISPPATSYQIKSFVEESKGKGNSFGTARDKIPDRSYLIPQMQRVPGPGTVFLYLLSMKMRSKSTGTLASLLVPNQLISSNPNSLLNKLQALVHTKR